MSLRENIIYLASVNLKRHCVTAPVEGGWVEVPHGGAFCLTVKLAFYCIELILNRGNSLLTGLSLACRAAALIIYSVSCLLASCPAAGHRIKTRNSMIIFLTPASQPSPT